MRFAQHLTVYENSDSPPPAGGAPPLVPLALRQAQRPSPAELREVLYNSKLLGSGLLIVFAPELLYDLLRLIYSFAPRYSLRKKFWLSVFGY